MNRERPSASSEARELGGEGRRSALAKLIAVGAGAAALATGLLRGRGRRDRRERELSEADLYGPHDLAG
jgi:hypothetical protein